MQKEILEKLVSEGYSQRELGHKLNLGQTSVRYWLKVHKLKTDVELKPVVYKCRCGETDPGKFYGHKKRICGKCHNKYCIDRWRERRDLIIKRMGGKCKLCGYYKHNCSIDIHHLDPKKKEPNFGNLRKLSWDKVLRYIVGCVLLCRNCHAAVHYDGLEINGV